MKRQAVNFINVIRAHFSYELHFGGFFLRMYVRTLHTYVQKKTAETTFVRKTRAFNVDEIDTSSVMFSTMTSNFSNQITVNKNK